MVLDISIKKCKERHGEDPYEFQHIVSVNNGQGYIECTCMKFTGGRVLDSYCPRALHACCVDQVSDQYLVKRWSKGIKMVKSIFWKNMGVRSLWYALMFRRC